ncbi:hypothetical protein [Paralysiella testudinis]|nr:hypothetical protein [Paralysiella testudinis]
MPLIAEVTQLLIKGCLKPTWIAQYRLTMNHHFTFQAALATQ